MGFATAAACVVILFYASGLNPTKLRKADLNPVNIYRAANRQSHLVYARGVKYVNDLRVVYEIQSRLRATRVSGARGRGRQRNHRPVIQNRNRKARRIPGAARREALPLRVRCRCRRSQGVHNEMRHACGCGRNRILPQLRQAAVRRMCARCARRALLRGLPRRALAGTAPAGAQPPRSNAGAAAALGLIPGLGAVYNGDYTRAIIHVAIWAGLLATGLTEAFGDVTPVRLDRLWTLPDLHVSRFLSRGSESPLSREPAARQAWG